MGKQHRFGPFLLDQGGGLLTRDGQPVVMQPLTYELLVQFVTQPGRLFTRKELTEALWPDTFVTESSLTQVVRRLRKALAPEKWVETVPRRGYRFLGEVQPLGPDESPPITGLFGRDDELRRLQHWTQTQGGPALLTLLGPGGVGKTALARRLSGTLVDLSAATRLADIVQAVGTALSIEAANRDAVAQIGWVLAGRPPSVVILDNVEQVIADLAPVLSRWMNDAPNVRWLVTSRSVLGLPQEQVMAVPPLGAKDATALLLSRGHVDAEDRELPGLVEALDGLPLAIELIAPRTRILPLSALVERLQGLLLRPSPVGRGRHQSLQSCFDASWALLDEPLRTSLGLLCAAVGPFGLPEARALLDDDLDEVDVIQALVDQAWLQVAPDKAGFAMLTTVRHYLEDISPSEVVQRGQTQHGAFWAQEGRRVRESSSFTEFHRLRRALPELLAACDRAAARGDGPTVVATTLGIHAVMRRTSPHMWAPIVERSLAYAEGVDRSFLVSRLAMAARSAGNRALVNTHIAEALRIAEDAGNPVHIAARRTDRSLCRVSAGDYEGALQDVHFAIDALEPLGPSHNLGIALSTAGSVLYEMARGSEALTAYEHAIEVHRACGSALGEAHTLGGLGRVLGGLGRSEESVSTYEAAVALNRRAGDAQGLAHTLANLAAQRAMLGDLSTAIVECREAIDMFEEHGNLVQQVFFLPNLAQMQELVGEFERAEASLERAIVLSRRIGRQVDEAMALGTLGSLIGRRGRSEEGLAQLNEAMTMLGPNGRRDVLVPLLTTRAHLRLERGDDEGVRQDIQQATALADRVLDRYSLVHLGCVEARLEAAQGHVDAARKTYADALRLADEGGWSNSPTTARWLEEARRDCDIDR
ncbi:MAG: winged helix-turn-helix domain-containing protein [Myxococcota bacterium]